MKRQRDRDRECSGDRDERARDTEGRKDRDQRPKEKKPRRDSCKARDTVVDERQTKTPERQEETWEIPSQRDRDTERKPGETEEPGQGFGDGETTESGRTPAPSSEARPGRVGPVQALELTEADNDGTGQRARNRGAAGPPGQERQSPWAAATFNETEAVPPRRGRRAETGEEGAAGTAGAGRGAASWTRGAETSDGDPAGPEREAEPEAGERPRAESRSPQEGSAQSLEGSRQRKEARRRPRPARRPPGGSCEQQRPASGHREPRTSWPRRRRRRR